MRMLSSCFDRTPALAAGTLCLALASFLTGCASKNPLMEEPVATNSKEAKPTAAQAEAAAPVQAPAQTAQAAKPAAPAQAAPAPAQTAETTPAPAPTASSGVQTTKERRILGFLSPYRPDIQQGNFVSQEMVSQLKEGMTREQVRFVMGTPLLTDIFHANRWDYVFRLQKGNGEVTSSRVTVFFQDNRLARFEGGNLPTETDYLARLAGAVSDIKISIPVTAPQSAPSTANEPK